MYIRCFQHCMRITFGSNRCRRCRGTAEDFIHRFDLSASAVVEIMNNLDGLKTKRRETLFYLLRQVYSFIQFVVNYHYPFNLKTF